MPIFNEFTFLSTSGENHVHVREWRPDGEAKAVLQLAHGVAEHIARYDDFARFMAENGFVTVGNDHLGHGKTVKSEADLCYFSKDAGWTHVVDDMHTLMLTEKEKYPKIPYFILGHSMGSFLTRTLLIRYPNAVDGAILSGTGYTPKPMIVLGLAVAAIEARKIGDRGRSELLNKMSFGAYNKAFEPAETPFDWLTRDKVIRDAYIADPLCGCISTTELFREMLNGISYIQSKKNLARMNRQTPVLIVSGQNDPVGGMGKGVRQTYRLFIGSGCTDVTLKFYPDARHEILNELNRQEVYGDILAWLNGHMH